MNDWRHIQKVDSELQADGRKIILFLNNFSDDTVSETKILQIRSEFFSPNMTAYIQPCDSEIIHAFKAIYQSF